MSKGHVSSLAVDARSIESLKARARQDPREGLKIAAQQFEGLFTQMMLKSMRDTVPQDGLFGSEQSKFFTSMLDSQMAQDFSRSGSLGLAKVLERQLGRYLPENPAAHDADSPNAKPLQAAEGSVGHLLPVSGKAHPLRGGDQAALPLGEAVTPHPLSFSKKFTGVQPRELTVISPRDSKAKDVLDFDPDVLPVAKNTPPDKVPDSPQAFVDRVWPHAQAVARETGIPAHFMVAQAALETGWGKHEIRHSDGTPSHNLFNIKAGSRWQGDRVATDTTEFINGRPQTINDTFRSYDSYGEAFRDYARLMQTPRYSGVASSKDGTEFAQSLQKAGYATDPMYASKLVRILEGSTLRQALMG